MSDQVSASSRPLSVVIPGFVIDLVRDELRTADGAPVELRPRSFAVLRLLAAEAGRMVTKDAIMSAVWGDMFVTEDSLTQCIADIRRAIGDGDRRTVRTIPRRGYLLASEPVSQPLATSAEPHDQIPAWRVRRAWPAVAAALAGIALALALLVAFWPRTAEKPWEMLPKTPDRPSLAVLAFKAGIPSAKNDLFAAGLATEIINELARNKDLRVIARDSSFALSGHELSPREIGERLHVRYLVDGTAQRIGETLTVAVQLIDTRDNTVAWADEFNATAENVDQIQPTVANRIAVTLHSGMRETEKHAILAHAPHDLDVREMTLLGLALKHQFNADATREGRRLLEGAIARDPHYAPAWAYLGWLNVTDILNQFSGEWGMSRLDEVITEFNRAIELDPYLPVAYQGLSRAVTFKGDLDQALRLIRIAIELGPGDADNLLFLATVLHQKGDAAGAVSAAEQAMDLNPLRPAYYARHYAEILWGAGRNAAALEQSEDCLRKAPKFTHCEIFRVLALVGLGRADEGRSLYLADVAHIQNFEISVQSVVPKPPGLAARYTADLHAAGWGATLPATVAASSRRP
jgi:TolB-like protein/DNA-binding winged helix-turn-helix (wHTH) protein/Tfp pilus assembly protein PilF